jgi:hypothetical protein
MMMMMTMMMMMMMDMTWIISRVYLIANGLLYEHRIYRLCRMRRLFEMVAFLIGSAYFVAGSYPDVALAIEDEFLDSTHDEYDMEAININTHSSKNPLVKMNKK